jgi:elongation factor P hydroxylase
LIQRGYILLNQSYQSARKLDLSEQQRLDLIVALFSINFMSTENTLLVGGATEPLYIPSLNAEEPHQLFFRENFVSSALHEIAHWCIAGKARRLQQDFGYWYQPDGRTVDEQAKFESMEVKPQALEWIFSNACDQKFTPSADNLNASDGVADDTAFKQALVQQARNWCQSQQLPPRAKIFIEALRKEFATADPYNLEYYQFSYLV